MHVLVVGAVTVGFGAYGLATGSGNAVPYVVMVVAGAVLVAALEPDEGFSAVALGGLTFWAAGHLAGGTVGLDHDRILYNALLPGGLHYDNVVHFVGFGSAGLVWWESTRRWLRVDGSHRVGIWVAVWLVGMGVGALNEVVEFIATLVMAHTNVGGYHNTGRDLVANMCGSAVAGTIAARRAERGRPAGSG